MRWCVNVVTWTWRTVSGWSRMHTQIFGQVQEGGVCQESFDTSLGGPQGSFSYCDGATVTAPQQNPCFHPKRPEQQDSFPQGREQPRASSPGFLGPVGASGNPSWLGYQRTVPTSESPRDRGWEPGSSPESDRETRFVILRDSFPSGSQFPHLRNGSTKSFPQGGWL